MFPFDLSATFHAAAFVFIYCIYCSPDSHSIRIIPYSTDSESDSKNQAPPLRRVTANHPALAIDPEQLKAVIQGIVANNLAEEAAKNELAQNEMRQKIQELANGLAAAHVAPTSAVAP